MNENHRELVSIFLTVAIISIALYIVHRFLPSMAWAAVIVIATYPLYKRWQRLFGEWHNTAALLFTLLLSGFILFPLSWLLTLLVKEFQLLINYLQLLNRQGGHVPDFIQSFPLFAEELQHYWEDNIGQPGKVREFLSNLHLSLTPASYYLKQIGMNIAHRGFQLGFTFLTLFFFYRDGNKLFEQINHVGEFCLGRRWYRYAERLPSALRGTVNGTIVVGLGVGLLMGICYALVGFIAPTLTGFITALAAMIPFVVPLVFAVVAFILFASGNLIAAIIVVIWGTLVMFIADHFVKPVLIGGAIQLPFLAVLFGILGGVETLGLLGLFIGPIVMVLFITLWQESQVGERDVLVLK
ncbi:MAG: AI-2E family transporter [Legionellaceae bacterium]|nr:AI-2E family transporter [Legionellaceae bacterium]